MGEVPLQGRNDRNDPQPFAKGSCPDYPHKNFPLTHVPITTSPFPQSSHVSGSPCEIEFVITTALVIKNDIIIIALFII